MGNEAANRWMEKLAAERKGKLKIYIGMSAGVGKSYRMLQEARRLLDSGVNIKIGYIETHQRAETEALLEGLPVIPRREVFYKGKRLEELDVQAVLLLHPDVVIIDELAHANIPGSKHEKRWQDVLDILDSGIDVISAVNIQHLESINDDVRKITGVTVNERVPDKMLQVADEVVNIDLTANELITRLKEGKIYDAAKVQQALANFFQPEKILQLRELALKEVAGQVERKVDYEVKPRKDAYRHERFLACISSNHETAQRVIRKTARLASYYNSQWIVLYVQKGKEANDKIPLAVQRHLINNFKNATELGAEIVQVKGQDVAKVIMDTVIARGITTVCIGKPHFNLFQVFLKTNVFNQLLKMLSRNEVDIVILS
ncbi:MAG: sensor protein KdpD [Sphingobacteriia bacterium]|nr:sensor protein KdpD [Sphingobacteriia bacterium]